jgi:hypothetical protein
MKKVLACLLAVSFVLAATVGCEKKTARPTDDKSERPAPFKSGRFP